jgi:hypothetical protein
MGRKKLKKKKHWFFLQSAYHLKTLSEENDLASSAGVAEWLTRWPRDLKFPVWRATCRQVSQWVFGLAGVQIPSPALKAWANVDYEFMPRYMWNGCQEYWGVAQLSSRLYKS